MALRAAAKGRGPSRLEWLVVVCVVLLIAKCQLAPRSAIDAATQKLTIREETGRVVLAWSGPISEPMRDDIAAALGRFARDPRPLAIALNSPGGSISQGREVMAAIREAARGRPIDTLVENGSVCASMCVPIYLLGAERMADPGAHFMFHEVSIDVAADRRAGQPRAVVDPRYRKILETLATDAFYENDIGTQRVNARWLMEMRAKIKDKEIWVSGRQLVEEGSGVVDRLVGTSSN